MNGIWSIEERDRWKTLRGRLDLALAEVAALESLTTRYATSPGYHLSLRDRDDIDRMVKALERVRDNALPCPDEQERSAA